MRITIAVGLLAMAVTGILADEDDDNFCLPKEQFDEAFPEYSFPSQYEMSVDGLDLVCMLFDEYNSYFNMTISPEKRFVGRWATIGAARTMACGSTRCK